MPAFASSTRRSRGLLALAAAAVAVAFFAGVAVFVMHRHEGGPAQPHARPVSPSGRAAQPSGAGPAGGVDVQQLTWTPFHGIWLPTSAQAGPYVQHGDLARGFAQTPTGALLAALHIVLRADAQWGPPVFTPTIRDQVIAGPDASALLQACRDYYASASQVAGVKDGAALGAAYVTEAGFRWQSYTPQAASLDLLSAGPGQGGTGTVQIATRVQLLWKGGDWKVVAPPGGTWENSASQVTSTSGFVLFPGRR